MTEMEYHAAVEVSVKDQDVVGLEISAADAEVLAEVLHAIAYYIHDGN